MSEILIRALNKLNNSGPDRVLTTHDGGSVPYKNAIEEYFIDVDIIFIRNDSWTLGCHRTMVASAYNLWKDEWLAVLIKPMVDPISIEYFLSLSTDDLNKILPPIKIGPRINQPKHRQGPLR